MQTANRINVSNGDVGVITDMKKEDDETITCVRLLDGRTLQYTQEMLEDLEFSYCTTIHKSQGQECYSTTTPGKFLPLWGEFMKY